ncbi:MAG TPA: WGR domain-containing protein, partial [Myxococcota bacterium]
MRRFELVEGSSSKFWSIELTGSSFTVVYGRIGTAGTTQEKTFDDDAKAKKEYDKLVAEKTKKGYAEVDAVAQTGTPSVKAAPAPKPAADKADKPAKAAKTSKAADEDAEADDVVTPAAAAPAAPAAPPKAPPSAAEENQVFWTDALKKRVLPRRGGVDAKIAALPTAAKAKAALQAALKPRATYLDAVVSQKHPGANELQKAVGIVAEGGDIDVETAAILVSWVNWSPDYKTESDPDVAVDFLVATYGYATATSALLIALEQSFLDRTGGQATSLQQAPADGWQNSFVRGGSLQGVDRLRELLVLASDDERAAAKAVADKARTSELAHAATTILFPEDGDLVAEDIDLFKKGGGFAWVLGSVTDMSAIPTPHGIDVSTLIPYRYRKGAVADLAATLLDGVGMAAASFFATLEPPPYANADMNKNWYGVLAAIGDDATVARVVEAIEAKEAQAALVEAAVNQPRRLLRLLGKKAATRGKAGEPARNVLATIVRRVPEIVEELLPHLEADAAKAIKALLEDAGDVVADASDKDIPAVLTSPPWHSKKAKAAGPSRPGLEVKAIAPALSWANKEREKYEAKAGWSPTTYDDAGWKAFVKGNADIDYNDLANAPAEHVPALLARGVNGGRWNTVEWYPRLIARHGVAVVDLLDKRLGEDTAGLLPHLVPLGVSRFAMPMATALATKKTLRDAARSWLVRHPQHA